MMPVESDFQCFSFTPAETKEALQFTPLQRAYLQNILGEKAHVKINLKVDPLSFNSFLQEEAYLTGQLDLLRTLLSPVLPHISTEGE